MYSILDVMDVIEANLSLENGGCVAFLPFERLENRRTTENEAEVTELITHDGRKFMIIVKEMG